MGEDRGRCRSGVVGRVDDRPRTFPPAFDGRFDGRIFLSFLVVVDWLEEEVMGYVRIGRVNMYEEEEEEEEERGIG